jgi:hypothetical protein
MDYVFTWVWADPNCRIIECLPESVLRLGMILQSPRLVQTAFSALVSEEALDIGTKVYHPCPKVSRGFGRNQTKFGRVIESLDEITSSMVEYAGVAFAGRIDKIMSDLCDPEMKWLFDLKSCNPLKAVVEHLEASGGDDHDKLLSLIATLKKELIHYVRGRILWCYTAQLDTHQVTRATEHRIKESWKGALEYNFGDLYDGLGEKEKIVTRYFWEILRDLDWGLHCTTNQIRDQLPSHSLYFKKPSLADRYGIQKVHTYDLLDLARFINGQILHLIKNGSYNNGVVTQDAALHCPVNLAADQLGQSSLNADGETSLGAWGAGVSVLNTPTVSPPIVNDLSPSPVSRFVPKLPMVGELMPEDSVFFSLVNLFREVDKYIARVCSEMLSRGDNDWSTTCDTLLCLTDEEYKFLPLYAGGLNDGTGGVFADVIPAAEKGPSGPGPAFHTGSTMGSRASSVADWDNMSDAYSGDTDMMGVDSSLGVEDGFSEDHIDRRAVMSEEDFPRRGGNETNLVIRGAPGTRKGKEVEGSQNEDIMSDNFLDTPDDEDDFDFADFEEDEGNLTE